jgi:hypothetical protein
MTITEDKYAEVIAAVERGDQTFGTIHVSHWCDGSTACAVESEPHGHWRGGYTVDGTEVLRRLIAENERLRAACTLALRVMEQPNKVAVPPYVKTVTVSFDPDAVAVLRAALEKKP